MMHALLEGLLKESLNEETIKQLSESLDAAFNEAVEAKAEEKAEVKRQELVVEYAKTYASDRETLVEALESRMDLLVAEQVEGLKGDISDFRDLEVEHAAKLVEAKEEMAANLQKDMKNLLEHLDTYIEDQVSQEMGELRQELTEAKKNQIGLRLFEAFSKEHASLVVVESEEPALRKQLEEAQAALAAANTSLNESQAALASANRSAKMEAVLSSLHGVHRTIMESVLANVETEKLEEAFALYIPRVLNEGVAATVSDKESGKDSAPTQALTENQNGEDKTTVVEPVVEGAVVTGNPEETTEQLNESVEAESLRKARAEMLRRAGL